MESTRTIFDQSASWKEELFLDSHDFTIELNPLNSSAWTIRLNCTHSFDEDGAKSLQCDLSKAESDDFIVLHGRKLGRAVFLKGYGGRPFSIGIRREGPSATLRVQEEHQGGVDLGDYSLITLQATPGAGPFRMEAEITKYPRKNIPDQELT